MAGTGQTPLFAPFRKVCSVLRLQLGYFQILSPKYFVKQSIVKEELLSVLIIFMQYMLQLNDA